MPEASPQSKPLDAFGFRSAEPTASKLRFYSIGIIAANKPLTSKEVEIYPVEELPMLDGELDDATDKYSASGTDASGKAYNTKTKMGNSIIAEWLPFCDSQRLTSPDVRRGETVMIYQFGDADKYYWTTLKNDNKLRKLETVIWAFSATQKESDPMNGETTYFFEVSTHKKLVTFHTSQADGERFGYDIQINTKDSVITITDTAGNKIELNSPGTWIRMENAAGSFVDINKRVITATAGDQIVMNTRNMTLNGSQRVTINTPDLRAP